MTEYPINGEGWSVFLQASRGLVENRRTALLEAERGHDEAIEAYRLWCDQPENLLAAWEPICARLSAELGTHFSVIHNGGGTLALSGEIAGVRVLVTDWLDGDLSHPQAGTGWWVGFSLPDAGWTGETESIIGDPDARGADGLVKLVAFAVSGYLRGERYPLRAPSEQKLVRIGYGVAS